MTSWVRILVLWLVALALPAHGIAAATMQFCAPALAGPSLGAQASPHGEGGAHHHAQAADDRAATPAPHDADPHAKLKCSAGAACCMASALPPGSLTLPAVKPPLEATLVVATRYVGPDSAGLERPPKPRQA